ncbi:hypothetical protein GCM10011487_38960 [Steroidobacter agaridevorans]|uniref:Uncharacterized protein n=1 Tax=Steroidobacter agaridevorans TaxID=2695856 RepID=A0A829YH47_9GAMM|nr:hypothetical protein [Steroidobacter agaridevorans]GFE81896.1 hypothetical protein GCM10011487_38960 [Steroidobacter agaridevorans]
MTREAYETLRKKGYALAGGLSDLSQRACVYHHMYEASGKRNVFPLIAAHGALWASGYFKKGMFGGKVLSIRYLLTPWLIKQHLDSLSEFADKFRDINRRVCAESYALYYYTRDHEETDLIRSIIGKDFAKVLYECHRSSDLGSQFSRESREELFNQFFRWEQENIVAPSVTEAYATFHWRAVKYLALRPRVSFSYFGKGYDLPFEDFSSKEERVAKGVMAYRRAEDVGLSQVEEALRHYGILPAAFFRDPRAHYQAIVRATLPSAVIDRITALVAELN